MPYIIIALDNAMVYETILVKGNTHRVECKINGRNESMRDMSLVSNYVYYSCRSTPKILTRNKSCSSIVCNIMYTYNLFSVLQLDQLDNQWKLYPAHKISFTLVVSVDLRKY